MEVNEAKPGTIQIKGSEGASIRYIIQINGSEGASVRDIIKINGSEWAWIRDIIHINGSEGGLTQGQFRLMEVKGSQPPT